MKYVTYPNRKQVRISPVDVIGGFFIFYGSLFIFILLAI